MIIIHKRWRVWIGQRNAQRSNIGGAAASVIATVIPMLAIDIAKGIMILAIATGIIMLSITTVETIATGILMLAIVTVSSIHLKITYLGACGHSEVVRGCQQGLVS